MPKFCNPSISVYRASAVVGFSESPNVELTPFNIRAQAVAPDGASTGFAGRAKMSGEQYLGYIEGWLAGT